MKAAQDFYKQLTGCAEHPDADLRLAAAQTHEQSLRYRITSRAPQGKIKRRSSSVLAPRLFKGHRP